jgi:hypothetical protein
MTSPGRYRNEPPDIVDTIKRLERRLEALEQNPRVGNTTLDTGTLRIKDANGDVRVQVGLLSDGTYGFEVLEDTASIFHQVPYVYTQTVPATPGTGETCSSTTYADLATIGPRVIVPVRSSGRILIIATAQIQYVTAQAVAPSNNGRFDVEFAGANTRNPNEVVDPLVGFLNSNYVVSTGTIALANAATITAQSTFENLNPGSTTITMKYRNSVAATNTSDFFRRTLTVISL